MFNSLNNLQVLDLSYNKLTKISQHSFSGLRNLKTLYLSGNMLLYIEEKAFSPFGNLINLDLSGTFLNTVSKQMFAGLNNIRKLNLSKNDIQSVVSSPFTGLLTLSVLDISQNYFTDFDKGTFDGLNNLQYLYTDSPLACCAKPSTVEAMNCPITNAETCATLLDDNVFGSVVWTMWPFVVLENTVALVYLCKSESSRGIAIILANFSISHILFGLYMFILALMDHIYSDSYVWNAGLWKTSGTCTFLGVLAVLAFESSLLMLTIYTIDRLKCIKRSAAISRKSALDLCVGAWIFALGIAVLPLVTESYMNYDPNKSYYSYWKTCFTLPITSETIVQESVLSYLLTIVHLVCTTVIVVGHVLIHSTLKKINVVLEGPDSRLEIHRTARLLIASSTSIPVLALVNMLG